MSVKGSIAINELFCKGCGLCISACPRGAISLAKDRLNPHGYHPAYLAKDICTGCGTCALMCPEAGISVKRVISSGPAEAAEPTPEKKANNG